MFKYIIKRIVNYVIMLFVAVSMTYFLASAFMDPRSNYMSRNPHPPIASINRSLDLANINDQTPVVIRYFRWLKGILTQWNWGLSPDQSPVAPAIASRISASLQLVTLTTVLSILFGVSIGGTRPSASTSGRTACSTPPQRSSWWSRPPSWA